MEHHTPVTTPAVRVFISHSSADRGTADDLADALRAAGLDVWVDLDGIRLGDSYAEEIYTALVASDAIVLILSPESIASPHVKREMNLAIDRAKPVLPFSLEVSLADALSPEWKYWLGIVQIEPLGRIDDAVRLIVERTRPAPVAPVRSRRAASAADPTPAIRPVLIQMASDRKDFAALAARLRHLRLTRPALERYVREFRDRGLIEFEEPLGDSTPLHLAT